MPRGPVAVAALVVSTLACLQASRPAPAAPPPPRDAVQELSDRFQAVSEQAAQAVVPDPHLERLVQASLLQLPILPTCCRSISTVAD